MDEVIKEVKGYEGIYCVTSSGRIYSSYSKRFLKGKLDGHGYLEVGLYKDGERSYFKIHRLVAKHFIDNPSNYQIINHRDGVKTNNDIKNLEWCTHKYNINHAFKTGLISRVGSKNNRSKLTEKDVIKIKELVKHKKNKEIAKMYNVVPSSISNIVTGHSWKHVK